MDKQPQQQGGPPQGQPGYGQPGYGQPGQPAMQPGVPPGQPVMQPGYAPGQPMMQPGYAPGQPMMQPGYAPGQPVMQPGVPPGQYGVAMQPVPGMQPQQQQVWMARPETIPGCPPGLEYLTSIDQLLVHQQIEMMEVFTNFEMENKFRIVNSMGQQVYFAQEESEACHRQCCGSNRGFTMHVTDNLGQEVIRVIREFKCCGGYPCCACGDACASEIVVESPPGTTVGYVRQVQACCKPDFDIQDENKESLLKITGPVCFCQGPCCTQDIEILVLNTSGEEVGKISKQWAGYVQEMYTKANNFGISFPVDLNVKIKAVMIGAVFLIDFMYFEQSKNNNRR